MACHAALMVILGATVSVWLEIFQQSSSWEASKAHLQLWWHQEAVGERDQRIWAGEGSSKCKPNTNKLLWNIPEALNTHKKNLCFTFLSILSDSFALLRLTCFGALPWKRSLRIPMFWMCHAKWCHDSIKPSTVYRAQTKRSQRLRTSWRASWMQTKNWMSSRKAMLREFVANVKVFLVLTQYWHSVPWYTFQSFCADPTGSINS